MKRPLTYLFYMLLGKRRTGIIRQIDAHPYMESVHYQFAGRTIVGAEEAQQRMADDIRVGKPFMAGRLGAVELSNMRVYEFDDERRFAANLQQLTNNAGFFPKDASLLPRFYDEMIQGCRECDYLAAWFQPFEEYYIKHVMKKEMCMTYLHYIDPFRCPEHPWTEALRGKRVLVIHPLAEIIEKQYYEHREELFPGTNILPEFELYTQKAVQTNAGETDDRYSDWFEALEDMYTQAMQIEFDLAILGCGAYGWPLAAKIKAAGRQAVHLGGITQVLFGIHGKRWDEDRNHQFLQQYYSDAWVRLTDKEKPKAAKSVENGCYW